MRAATTVKPYIQKELIKKHPECFERFWDPYSIDEKYEDELLILSAYDHRLTEQEANEALVEGHPDHPEYYQRMYQFFIHLDNVFDTFLVKSTRRGRLKKKLILKRKGTLIITMKISLYFLSIGLT